MECQTNSVSKSPYSINHLQAPSNSPSPKQAKDEIAANEP
ncbi:hypothetical protein BVRB_7g173690 [Beta vulgaris subsp. vulgaris]|nr:hypothetical protein BVRB_7g173690 [Beta vulgaris subsp. vulgaris]